MYSKYLVAIGLGIALDGCPYTASSPIAEPSTAALDQGLLGEWRCIGGDNSDATLMTITKKTSTEFVLGYNKDSALVPLHSAKSGKVALVNMEDPKPSDDKPWSLLRMTLLRPTVLQIELAYDTVFEKAVPGTRSADIVAKALKAGTLFKDAWVCARSVTGP